MLVPVRDFLRTPGARFAPNYFGEVGSRSLVRLEEFVDRLERQGVRRIFVEVDRGVAYADALVLQENLSKLKPGAWLTILAYRPDEFNRTREGLRLWWD